MSKENVDVVRQLYDAVARHDWAAVQGLYDPEVVYDLSRVSSWGDVSDQRRIHHGLDELHAVFRNWMEAWDDLRDDVEELIDAGDQVVSVATSRGRGRASGVDVELAHYTGVWTIRGGRVVRVVWFETRAEALEAAGLSE